MFDKAPTRDLAKLEPWAKDTDQLLAEGKSTMSGSGNRRRSPADFVLWKVSKPGEPTFNDNLRMNTHIHHQLIYITAQAGPVITFSLNAAFRTDIETNPTHHYDIPDPPVLTIYQNICLVMSTVLFRAAFSEYGVSSKQ